MANGKPKWTKAGHRSIKHNSYPKMVVRFGGTGTGPAKPKLLVSPSEFMDNEIKAGRDPQKTLANLVDEATARWKEIRAAEDCAF